MLPDAQTTPPALVSPVFTHRLGSGGLDPDTAYPRGGGIATTVESDDGILVDRPTDCISAVSYRNWRECLSLDISPATLIGEPIFLSSG